MSRKESSDEAVKIDRITIVREGGRDKLRQWEWMKGENTFKRYNGDRINRDFQFTDLEGDWENKPEITSRFLLCWAIGRIVITLSK
jgi:hypothetical protein